MIEVMLLYIHISVGIQMRSQWTSPNLVT